jgi:hypothetical protein
MLRRSSTAAVAVILFSLAGAGGSFAAEKPHHERKAPHATGEVVSVDAATHVLTLKTQAKMGSTKEMSFSLPADAKVMKDGQTVAVADLKPGEQITVTYRTKDVHFAEEIRVVDKPAASPK